MLEINLSYLISSFRTIYFGLWGGGGGAKFKFAPEGQLPSPRHWPMALSNVLRQHLSRAKEGLVNLA